MKKSQILGLCVLSLLLCLTVALGVYAADLSSAGLELQKYDLNDDGRITIGDVTACLDYLSSKCPHNFENNLCTKCGEPQYLADDGETPPEKEEHSHNFSQWIDIKQPSCTEDGLSLRCCIDCRYTESKLIPATGHVEEIFFGYPASCLSDGLTDGGFCKVCGTTTAEQTPIPALGHSMVAEHHEEAASCTYYGYVAEEKCIRCSYRPALSITAPLGHTLHENNTCTTCQNGVDEFWHQIAEDDGDGQGINFRNWDQYMISVPADVIMPTSLGWGSINKGLYYETFYGNPEIQSLTIPEYYTTIGSYFASYCENLRYVYIPSTATYIASGAFAGCYNLEIVHYGGTVAQWNALEKTAGWDPSAGNYTVYCTDGAIQSQS